MHISDSDCILHDDMWNDILTAKVDDSNVPFATSPAVSNTDRL